MTLEEWDHVAQIAMAATTICALVAAILGAKYAYQQYTLVQLFELLKRVEDERVREARRTVMNDIGNIVRADPSDRWWTDASLEKQAALLCATYDHLASAFRYFPSNSVSHFFFERWGETAVKAQRILKTYIDYRRIELGAPKAYDGFDWFCAEAKSRHPNA
ncbi:MAG: hypothetical protein AB7V13_27215 [Pseudorhodoplanes sp.]